MSEPEVEAQVAGFFLHAAVGAFVHLRMLGGPQAEELCLGVDPTSFYPLARITTVLEAVRLRHGDMEPVLEQLGIQMMTDWYHHGPGKGLISSGLGFLHFQTGSQGYRSVVRGPDALIGEFALQTCDEKGGTAVVRSTTPFPKPLERGVLLGGMRAPGDLAFVDVENVKDPSTFEIRFH